MIDSDRLSGPGRTLCRAPRTKNHSERWLIGRRPNATRPEFSGSGLFL